MTLFAGLKVSTLGLSAQGTKMGAISDNIANVNTVGYKRTDVQFSTLVTERIRETRFTPGGVTARPRQTVDQAGQLLGTGLSTDFAVSGRGMFIVTKEPEFTPQTSEDGLAYTRAGSFRVDQDGFLKNTAGYYLQGWTVNRNKQVTLDAEDPATIINSPNFSNLQPVNANRFSNLAEQTENLRTRANLPADFTVTTALAKPEIDPSSPFVLSTAGLGSVTGVAGGATVSGATIVNDNDGAVGSAFDLNVTIAASAEGATGPVTVTAAQLQAAGFDPTSTPTARNTLNDLTAALNGVSSTLSTGEAVRFSASVSTGGNIVINATVNGGAATVGAITTTSAGPGFATSQITANAGARTLDLNGANDGAGNTYNFPATVLPATTGATAAGDAAEIAGFINAANITNDATGVGAGTTAGTATLQAQAVGDDVQIFVSVGGVRQNITAFAASTLTNAVNPALAAGSAAGTAGTLTVFNDAAGTDTALQTFGTGRGSSVIKYGNNTTNTNTAGNQVQLPAANAFNITIDNVDVTFALTGNYNGTGGTLQNLVTELNAASFTSGSSTFTVDARIAADGGLVVIGKRDGAPATTLASLADVAAVGAAAISTIDFDGGGALGAVQPTSQDEGVSATTATISNTFDLANERRAQWEDIVSAAGNSGDYSTVSTVFDALGQPHQVTLNWFRYQSDTAGPNSWAVTIADDGIDGIKNPLVDITNPDATVNENGDSTKQSEATVPRFITYGGNDGNESVDEDRVTQSQSLFMKFNGDGSLEGVYTDPLFSSESRVGNRETTAGEPVKMIQIAVGRVVIDETGAAGGRTTENLAVGIEQEVNVSTSPFTSTDTQIPSPFGTDGAKPLVFDWDVGRPTNVKTAAGSAVNPAFAGTGLDGLTQFDSGEAIPALETYFTSQDGLRAGVLTGVGLDEDGILTAFFDNGAQRAIYKVPLVSFVNFNGLINESGNIYRESRESGQAQINAAGQGLNGDLVGGALEQSNVELADEFTDMIITQQGFTANTRAITTTDEMLTDINNMVR